MVEKNEGNNLASQASPSTADTDTILAAIASHGAGLSKICTLVDDMKVLA